MQNIEGHCFKIPTGFSFFYTELVKDEAFVVLDNKFEWEDFFRDLSNATDLSYATNAVRREIKPKES